MPEVAIQLDSALNDIAREEFVKAAPYLSSAIQRVEVSRDGRRVICSIVEPVSGLENRLASVARDIGRTYRGFTRATCHVASSMSRPFDACYRPDMGIHVAPGGIACLSGVAARLYKFMDRVTEELGNRWNADVMITPALIEVDTIRKCQYFQFFPHVVTFASHLPNNFIVVDNFRQCEAAHVEESNQKAKVGECAVNAACVTPATCLHVYRRSEHKTVQVGGVTVAVCGRCARHEAVHTSDLTRLWDFTMREFVCLGTRQEVLGFRCDAIEAAKELLGLLDLTAEIRTASDPFFIAPEMFTKARAQFAGDMKLEVVANIGQGQQLAIGSINYHTDFFGRAFDIASDVGVAAHSGCLAFGLERCVYAFLCQMGEQPAKWPSGVRDAKEFRSNGEPRFVTE